MIVKTKKNKYKAITKPKRKTWCIKKAMSIIENRNDQHTLTQIKKSKKKDDLCDVICQLQAFKYLCYVDTI